MKRPFFRADLKTGRNFVIAALIVAGLVCHFSGGIAAAVGVPLSALCALFAVFSRRVPLPFRGKPSAGTKIPRGTEPLLRIQAQRHADESIAQTQISALGKPFRKERWDQTETTIDALVDSCIDLVSGRTSAHTVAVFFPTAGEGFAMRRFRSRGANIDPHAVLRPGLGVLGGFFKNGLKTLNLQEILSDSTTLYYYTRDEGVRSLIACPIVAANAERGVIIADSTEKQAFTDEHLAFVSAVAGLLGNAAYHAYLCTEHTLQHLRLAAVSTIEKELFGRHTIDEILDIVAEIIPFAFPCERMTISMRSDDGETATIRRCYGRYTELLLDREFSLTGKSLAGVLYAKNICLSRDFAADRYEIRYFEKEPRCDDDFASFLAVPLGVDDCKGMVLIESSKRDAFADPVRGLLSRIATSAGLAMEKVRILEKAHTMATHDGLTGLFNHRQFQSLLKDEITRSSRYGDPLSLVLCDIDFFKKTNDTYGHPFGDAVLRSTAKLLEVSIREGVDTAARYGGEEFALILIKTDERQAVETAERIREAVERNPVRCPAGNDVHVTMSFGIAEYGKHAKELDELIKKADKALYRAKEQGRNRVEVF